jgi:adenylate cyclase
MSLKDDIRNKVKTILATDFSTTEIEYIPRINDTKLTFSNTGLKFQATVVFIDMRGSTATLNKHHEKTVAKIHMSYFHTIVKIANANNGHVRSFNGDSALIFFQGTTKLTCSNAVTTAMKIKYMLSDSENGINILLKKYSQVDFGIGIDHGEIICTKVGISGEHNRDLFWIGNCVNKSTVIGNECRSPNHIGISHYVYINLIDNAKYYTQEHYGGLTNQVNVWNPGAFLYNEKYEDYYRTNFHWEFL